MRWRWAWFVPLSTVLDAHDYHDLKPYAFATSALASFISPLVFGAMADRHAAPVVVLRWLAIGRGGEHDAGDHGDEITLEHRRGAGVDPTFPLQRAHLQHLYNDRVLAAERFPQRIRSDRAMATFGWMAGCWLISFWARIPRHWLDTPAPIAWLGVAAYTFVLPNVPPPESTERLTLRQRMGWDALALLKNPDHRVVFITAALFNDDRRGVVPSRRRIWKNSDSNTRLRGCRSVQITELIAMFMLGIMLTRWRLKWIFMLGLGLAVFALLLVRVKYKNFFVGRHHFAGRGYTLVIITSQIYLEQRIDPMAGAGAIPPDHDDQRRWQSHRLSRARAGGLPFLCNRRQNDPMAVVWSGMGSL